MKTDSLTVRNATTRLPKLLSDEKSLRKPLHIKGKKRNAVLISEESWRSIQETLYLLSIPQMRGVIRRGLRTPIEKCSTELDW